MRISLSASVRPISQTRVSNNTAVLAGVVLLLADAVLLCVGFGFAQYALGGLLFWPQANGMVVNARNSSRPTVQYVDADGTPRQFHEDYILLCGSRRSFCWVRRFTVGESVPVVYDPRAPDRAYIHDWALTANALTWFFEAFLGVLLLGMVTVRATGKARSFSIRIGQSAEAE